MICQVITHGHYANIAVRAILQNYGYTIRKGETEYKQWEAINVLPKYNFQDNKDEYRKVRSLIDGVIVNDCYRIIPPKSE